MALQEIKNLPPRIFSMELKISIPWVDEDSIHTSKYLIPQVNSLCPTQCYTIEQDKVMILHEGCIECGSCSKETDWKHPRG